MRDVFPPAAGIANLAGVCVGNLQRQKGGILSVIIYHEPSPACSVTRTPTQAPALCSPPRSQKGQLNPRQVLFISCSNSTVAPMLLRTSPSLLRPVRGYTGTPHSISPPIPPSLCSRHIGLPAISGRENAHRCPSAFSLALPPLVSEITS